MCEQLQGLPSDLASFSFPVLSVCACAAGDCVRNFFLLSSLPSFRIFPAKAKILIPLGVLG